MQTPLFRKTKAHDGPKPNAFEVYWTRRRMWIAVTWSVMVASLATGYYFVVFLPAQGQQQLAQMRLEGEMQARLEQARLDQEKQLQLQQDRQHEQDRQENQALLDSCLQAAEKNYVMSWDRECVDRSLPSDCRLPNALSDQLSAAMKELKDECFKRFPQDQPGLHAS